MIAGRVRICTTCVRVRMHGWTVEQRHRHKRYTHSHGVCACTDRRKHAHTQNHIRASLTALRCTAPRRTTCTHCTHQVTGKEDMFSGAESFDPANMFLHAQVNAHVYEVMSARQRRAKDQVTLGHGRHDLYVHDYVRTFDSHTLM